MSLPRAVAEVIDRRVTLEPECLDRVCFNAHRPELQSPPAVFLFRHVHSG